MQRSWNGRRAAIAMRLDIRQAAGKQKPIQLGKERVELEQFGESRDDERHRARSLGDCADVFFPCNVKDMVADQQAIGGNSNNGKLVRHGWSTPAALYSRPRPMSPSTDPASYYVASTPPVLPSRR